MPQDRERVIVAKFAGRCSRCDTLIKPGEKVYWTPGMGIRHHDEIGCSNAADAVQQYDGPGDLCFE